jgi:CRP-like cAMP-binding protein
MSTIFASEANGNRLLAAMSAADKAWLRPHLEYRELAIRHSFEEPNRPIKYVYFIESGFASLVAASAPAREVEVGLIGREGVTGLPVLLGGDRSPHACYVQLAGSGHRIGARILTDGMEARPGLRKILLKFAQTFMTQTAQTALANGRARIEARLARWILMGHDRIDGDYLALTHEFLSIMLGVRRAGVTVAIRSLEKRGLIRGNRARIVIVDRAGLEQVAGRTYGVPEAEYRRLIG